jgi:PAS domain S-box-containing protein
MEKLRLDTEYIVQNLSSGLFTVDRDGRVVHFNRAAEILLGVSAGQLRGRNLAEALGPAPRELVRTVLATLEEEIPFLRAEVRLYAEDDTARPLGVSTSLLKDAQDRKTGVVALFQDLTEVRRLEAASRRQDRLSTVGEMAAPSRTEVRNL